MNAKTSEIKSMIEGALNANPTNQMAALKACRWRMRGPAGEFVGLGPIKSGLPCAFVSEDRAQLFDGRDNQDHKLAFYERSLGPLTIEVLPVSR